MKVTSGVANDGEKYLNVRSYDHTATEKKRHQPETSVKVFRCIFYTAI